MAPSRYDDPDDDDFYHGSLPIEQQQEFLYDQLGFVGPVRDEFAHQMFWEVMYNDELSHHDRMQMYDTLSDYLDEEYGIDFSEIWDWEDFRAWYDGATA